MGQPTTSYLCIGPTELRYKLDAQAQVRNLCSIQVYMCNTVIKLRMSQQSVSQGFFVRLIP